MPHTFISMAKPNNPKRLAKCNPKNPSTSPHPFHPILPYSHTHQNSTITATKNPSHAFHPTPVFWAILNILPMVPFILFREFSNWSFIFSARAVESRISSPMRCVN
jgi:hypothetical protein